MLSTGMANILSIITLPLVAVPDIANQSLFS